jgi:hypothetical protein
VGRDDADLDPALRQAVFRVSEGGATPLLQDVDGTYLLAQVTQILPPTDDPAYMRDLQERISTGAHRDNTRLEALAQRLEDGVVADATTGDKPQVHLAEIFLAGDPEATEDSGRIHAAHILYAPDDGVADDLPGSDPAWTVAQSQAGLTAAELRRITDPTTRGNAFTELAAQSDDRGSGDSGGDLGWFDRATMVPEFADPLFEAVDTLKPGDIVGPVRSDFGWHVIQFLGYEPPLADRRTQLTEALTAPDADFAAVATDLSDGAEAQVGGDLGWRLVASLPAEASEAIAALQPDGISEPIALEDGYHVYQLLERADRPLDPAQLASVAANAFADWYQPIQDEAEKAKRITRDDSLFEGV